jgi:hypothetical protein
MSEESRAALVAEMIRLITDDAFTPPQFPERRSVNPEYRAARVAERALGAPGKVYEVRERSVRTSGWDADEIARVYLRDMYTNDAKQMICQSCQEEMPFRLANGDYYFESKTALPSVSVELSENHLALCPTCAAKWQHARTTTDEEILVSMRDGRSPELNINLAGKVVALRFVERHYEDIRAALGGLDGAQAHATG